MTKKISKKFIIILSVLVAAVLLTAWTIVSGTAESVSRAIKFQLGAILNPPAEPDFCLIDDLKPGKYLLQREWGLDETDYIEVFDDHTLQFVGAYWNERKAEELERSGDCYDYSADVTERNRYELLENAPTVMLGEYGNGFTYLDENTLLYSRLREEENDVVDHDGKLNQAHHPERIDACYVFSES